MTTLIKPVNRGTSLTVGIARNTPFGWIGSGTAPGAEIGS